MAFKVLLIDDEPWALEGLQLWIPWENLGFEVCGLIGNGAEGLKQMEELKPDLVMVDIRMPVMDGLEMIEEWRRRGNWLTKFIILTGYSDFEFARKALKFKVSGYLLKPLDEEQAESEVRRMGLELIKEQEQLYIGQIALREQEMLTMKQTLLGKVLSAEGAELMESLSRSAEAWNVCLVQVSEEEYGRWSSLAAEVLNGPNVIYIIRMRNDLVSIVFGDVSPDPQGTSGKLRKQLEALARRLVSFRTYMAIGTTEFSLNRISNSRITAEKALLHAFYEAEWNGIMEYTFLQNHNFQRHYNQVELSEHVLGAFQLIDYASYRSAVEFIEQSFRQTRVHPDEVRKFVIYLLHEIRAYMGAQMAENSEHSYRLFEIPDLDEALLTFEDWIRMLHSCGKVCFELLLKENTFEAQGIVQDINDYIHVHFREGLTIKLLAERFFLHPAYLGQLLIRKNGMGFNELLHNLRIEEACRLLQMNQYKNSEVSEKVGYASYNHFLKQFEKRMGMSPNEYKKT
ncbi:response regulator transcription factor [Paenibacillus xylanivorans]|uniref:Chemotaxis protein CheY n=1 Tax=Paenibacillus xylanivorans TaxID=1705561 RepID=A0A0N0C4W7_9BACL|nr:response regulator [Paenibacillus xylanivorans]KOY16374.1 chemotaxis protein CheY [Paenibacillus xylanivorans]